jgi:hypothetical protein
LDLFLPNKFPRPEGWGIFRSRITAHCVFAVEKNAASGGELTHSD